MSAGTSSSSGTENSRQNSTGTRTGTSTQDTNQNTIFNNQSVAQTMLPAWAKAGNRQMFGERSAGSHEAIDFLSGLLSNPLDQSEPKNRYATALDNLFRTQLTRARSGDAQSVGVGKQAMREASALTDAQTSAIGTGTAAARALLTEANPYASLDFARLIAPNVQSTTGTANTTGRSTTKSDEQTTGQQQSSGTMSGNNSGFGITLCCFIFLEAYHGSMPWYVRRCRDQFCSGRRVHGYRRMANWLVPWMQRSKLVASMVWWTMIRPLTKFGGWLYDEPEHCLGWLYGPITAFWFGLWAITGKEDK